MAQLTRLLHERVKGAQKENKERWRLAFDTEAKRLYIEHEWSHADMWRDSRSNSGSVEFEINAFLAEGEEPAQAELMQVIESLRVCQKAPKGKTNPLTVWQPKRRPRSREVYTLAPEPQWEGRV
jgi:hypothetical protein